MLTPLPFPPPPSTQGADLVYIKTANTTSGYVEIHIITAVSAYQTFGTVTGLAMTRPHFSLTHPLYTSSQFTYLVSNDGNQYIMKFQGASGLELYRLSASSNFQTINLEVVVPTPYSLVSKDTTKFALGSSNDLYMFTTGGTTDSGWPELHVLSSASNYQTFIKSKVGILRTYSFFSLTAIWYTQSSLQFLIGSNNDLYLLKLTSFYGWLELIIVPLANNYQGPDRTYYKTAFGSISKEYATFHLGPGDDVYGVAYRGASSSTELHIASRSSNYLTLTVTATVLTDPTVNYGNSFFPNGDSTGVVLFSVSDNENNIVQM